MSTNERTPISQNSNVVRGVIAIVLAFVAFSTGKIGALIKNDPLNANAVSFAVRSVAAFIPFILLGGKTWFVFKKKTVGKTLKFTLPMLISNAALSLLILAALLTQGVSEGVLGKVATTIYISVLTGFNEELIFRGLLFQGIHTIMGKKKSAILFSALISSVIFGVAHVVYSVDYSSIMSIVTAFLKVMQTGVYSFVLCYCCYFFKDIRGAIISHSIFDWVLLVLTVINDTAANMSISYSTTDTKNGIVQIVEYVIMLIIYIPCTIKAFKALKGAEPAEGLFSLNRSEPVLTNGE